MMPCEAVQEQIQITCLGGSLYIFEANDEGGVIKVIRPDIQKPEAFMVDLATGRVFNDWQPEFDLSKIRFESYDEKQPFLEDDEKGPLTDVLNVFELAGLVQTSIVQDGELLHVLEPETIENQAWRQAFSLVPVDLRLLVTQFLPSAQWSILCACLRYPYLQDMDNFGLLYLHASCHLLGGISINSQLQELTPLFRRPRKNQAGFYGLSETRQIVKMLGKLTVDSLEIETFKRLLDLLKEQDDDLLKTFSHLKQITPLVIHILYEQKLRDIVTPSFLAEIVSADRNDDYLNGVIDNLSICMHFGEQLGRSSFKVRSVEGLISLRNNFTQIHIHKLKCQNPDGIEWLVPPPPVPGLHGLILPLDSSEKIREHGDLHANCVSTYLEDVAEGNCYLYAYRLLCENKVEEGTISLVRDHLDWSLGEHEAKNFTSISEPASEVISSWLDFNGVSRD